jgi:3-deoxy-D-manno-octulosonate 8-phosphate phosphatase (KDO 8-P phosphatase)
LGKLDIESQERAGKVRLILLDADGVLTDGRITMSSDGSEIRSFHVQDGFGIRLGRQAGLEFGILSGRASPVLERRAEELGITEVHQGILDKAGRFQEILQRLDIPAEFVCFVGDDLIDLPVMRRSGFAVATADAQPDVREGAHYVTERRGGEGAVREVVDIVLRASGKWNEVTQPFLE